MAQIFNLWISSGDGGGMFNCTIVDNLLNGMDGSKATVTNSIIYFNGDGSLDLAVVLTNGILHCFYNDLTDRPALRLRLPKGVTGPVTASCWLGGKHPICTAVATVAGHAPPAYVTARYPGTVTIRFRPPGGGATVQKAKAEAGATDVVLKIPAGK